MAVVYSANLNSSNRRKPNLQQIVTSQSATSPVLYGRVEYSRHNSATEDPGSVLLLWPVEKPEQPYALTSQQLFEHTELYNKGALICTQATVDGEYVVASSELPGQREANYYVLALSAARQRDVEPALDDLEQLDDYFQDPLGLLGDKAYQLTRLELASDTPLQWNVRFDAHPKASEGGSTAATQ